MNCHKVKGSTRGEQVADGQTLLTWSVTGSGLHPQAQLDPPQRERLFSQHSRGSEYSIHAGMMRRSFLKGMGMQQNCAPPAAPRWFRLDAKSAVNLVRRVTGVEVTPKALGTVHERWPHAWLRSGSGREHCAS
jgi:hypothetical protein